MSAATLSRRRPLHAPLWTILLALSTLSACSGTRVTPDAADAPRPAPALVPMPAIVELSSSETFTITHDTEIYVEPGLEGAVEAGRFLAALVGNTEEDTPRVVAATGEVPAGSIHLTARGADVALGDEGYALTVTPDRVEIVAPAAAGLFYGVQTLRQLLPPAVEYTAARWETLAVPGARIVDRPRFAWRGAMLDVARHFLPVEDVERYVDLMALHKLNRLHLHLSDDQGWRIEIPSWPNLTAHGGSTEVGGGEGGFYTQEEYARLVDYARERHVTIVPEIDMPGHINAALASYPELNCDGVAPELYTGIEVGFSALCLEKEITYEFVDDVVREIAAMTPGPFFHVGGDEVHELAPEAYRGFIERVQEIVLAHGKRPVAWDEVAEADLDPSVLRNMVVQVWRPSGSEAALREAVEQGARLVLSPADRVYLDMKYDSTTVLGLTWAGYNDVRDAYDWDPSALLPEIAEEAILGVEAPLWSETLGRLSDFEHMAFPRLAGVAEIGWSPAAARDWPTYRLRLAAQAPRWSALGVRFYRAPEVPWER